MNDLTIYRRLGTFGGVMFLLSLVLVFFMVEHRAATITTGYTFSSGETNITHTKLNQAVNSATLSDVTTADILDSAITGPKIAASTITGSKIKTNTVSGGASGNLQFNTVADTNMVVNTLTPVSITSNYVALLNSAYRYTNAGVTLEFANDQIASAAVLATNKSSGTGQSGLLTKLNAAHGKLDPSLYYATTNRQTVITAATTASSTLSTLLSYTTTQTNGIVFIWAQAQYTNINTGGGSLSIAIDDGSTTLSAVAEEVTASDPKAVVLNCQAMDTLVGAAKTYNLKGRASGNAGGWAKNGASPVSSYGITNATQLIVIEQPAP